MPYFYYLWKLGLSLEFKYKEIKGDGLMNRYEMIEIDQAINAGNRVLERIDEVYDYLSSASNWGLFDMLSKGGFISGMIKHSKLRNAQEAMDELRYELNVFNSELDDVRVNNDVGQLEMSEFMKFADFFFDGFLVDFMVLSRINESKRKLDELGERVERVIDSLYALGRR